jgi:hypothetical protein
MAQTVPFKTTTILDIIQRPAFYFKHNVSETGFGLRDRDWLFLLGTPE